MPLANVHSSYNASTVASMVTTRPSVFTLIVAVMKNASLRPIIPSTTILAELALTRAIAATVEAVGEKLDVEHVSNDGLIGGLDSKKGVMSR